MSGRKLYWTYTNEMGLLCLVDKVRGAGVLKSYGQHHQTELDNLLGDAGFETTHPDQYLCVRNKITNSHDGTVFTNKQDALKAVALVNKYFNCSERKELNVNDFFALLNL